MGSVPSATPIITATPMHMCQPLLDAVATNMKSPMFNHALQQTFGPAMTALFGAPIRFEPFHFHFLREELKNFLSFVNKFFLKKLLIYCLT